MEITLIQHPPEFKEGTRILMLATRSKDGHSNKVIKKYISQNPMEYDAMLQKLLEYRTEGQRIYATVDPRDMEKAIREFKHRLLDADDYKIEDRYGFYTDVYNRFISCLQSPRSRKEKLFMVDIDTDEGNKNSNYEKILEEILAKNLEMVHDYPTKNGRHIILKPFNPRLVSFEVRNNQMMLLAY